MLAFWTGYGITAFVVLMLRVALPRRLARTAGGVCLTMAVPTLVVAVTIQSYNIALPLWLHAGLFVMVAAQMHWIADLLLDELRRIGMRRSAAQVGCA